MNIEKLPMLFCLSSTGKLQQWQVTVKEVEDGSSKLIMESGQVGKKIRVSEKIIKVGKNIGKKNETTTFSQAISMAHSEFEKRRYANYELFKINKDDYVPRVILPQLASGEGKIVYPCNIQKKLNGISCMVRKYQSSNLYKTHSRRYINWAIDKRILNEENGPIETGIIYHSRGGHEFETVPHLTNPLMEILNVEEILQGELYKHGWSLQKIGSYTKELKKDFNLLEFWVYDYPNTDIHWLERDKKLHEIIPSRFYPSIRILDSEVANSYEDAKRIHDGYVQEGFEGAILRNFSGMYGFEFRSKHVEKLKEYKDAEFEIVGGKEGTGTDAGCVIFRCKIENGKEFDVRPVGDVDVRREYLINLDKLIGKMLTVKFFEYSDDGIPLQPTGKPGEGLAIRDYE